MIPRKLLEATFRRLWLLVIPIVVTPLLVLALTKTTPQYQSTATIWVSQPANIAPGSLGQPANAYQTAADTRSQTIGELLTTKTFRAAVAQTAGLPATTASETLIGRSVQVASAGANLITISATGVDPKVVQALVGSVISQYQARSAAESERQTAIAVEYYTKQIDVASTELDHRRTALNTYLKANPGASDPKAADFQFQQLSGAVDSQSKVVAGLLSSLQDAQRQAASAPQSLEASFSVQDSANLPTAPEKVSLTKRVGYPAAGLVLGILISAGYLYVTYRTDHAIRSSEDLQDLSVPLLGYIPDLPARHPSGFARFAPWRWLPFGRRRDYARAVAASISTVPSTGGAR